MKQIFVAAAILSSLLSVSLDAQSLLQHRGQILATNGDAIPGLGGGEVFGGTSTFDTGVLDDQGNVFFRGRMTGGSATATTDRALFLGTSRGDLMMVIRSGDPEPTGLVPGATLNTATSTGISGSNRISPNGTLFFGAALNGGGVTSANDSAIYVGTPGNLQMLVREGDIATNGAATFSSSFASPSQQQTCINDSGQVMFLSNLTGGDVVGTTNNQGLFSGTAGNLVLAARKGDVGPNGEVVLALSPAFVGQMNILGQIIFDVSFVVGSGLPAVTAADDRAIWFYDPFNGVTPLVREGDALPSNPGVTLSRPANNGWSVNTGVTTFNTNGQLLIRSDLGGAVNFGTDDSAVVLLSLSGHSIVARMGSPAPIAGTTFGVFNNTSLRLTNSGIVAFQCTLVGPSVTAADDEVIVVGTPGNYAVVAREGDMAPGTAGGVFGGLSGQFMLVNDAGQILFANSLVGGSNPGSSTWSWDPILGLQPAILTGEMIEVQTGVFKSTTSSGGIQFGNGDNRPLTFANDGTFTVRVSLSDGTAMIVKNRIGTLTGVPSVISENDGGVHVMYLDAGLAHANELYVVIGSLSGTTPGTTFGAFNIPLNFDFYTNFMITSANVGPFFNTFSVLDASGRGAAALIVPPGIAGIAGLTVNHAFVTLNAMSSLAFVSEASTLSIIP